MGPDEAGVERLVRGRPGLQSPALAARDAGADSVHSHGQDRGHVGPHPEGARQALDRRLEVHEAVAVGRRTVRQPQAQPPLLYDIGRGIASLLALRLVTALMIAFVGL